MIDLLEIESNSETFPNYCTCPITREKMETPVVSMEGHSYISIYNIIDMRNGQ